jgi:hypothetical protein
MGGVGDFAEMLINQQIAGSSPSVQRASNVKQRDIRNVEVPNDLMRDILSESFDVESPVTEETIEEPVQSINEDILLTENTAKELIHSIQDLKDILVEMCAAGSMGVNLGNPAPDPMKPYNRKTKRKTKRKSNKRSNEYILRHLKNT